MKKMLFSSIALLLMVNLFAQRPEEGPQKQPPTIEQRWKRDSVKLQTHLSLSAAQTGKLKNAFVSFYKDLDALAAKDRTMPPPREEVEKIRENRKKTLKNILTSEQFTRFETFEKEFMPPPPGKRNPPPPKV